MGQFQVRLACSGCDLAKLQHALLPLLLSVYALSVRAQHGEALAIRHSAIFLIQRSKFTKLYAVTQVP